MYSCLYRNRPQKQMSSTRNCKTKLWKEMETRAGRKGEIWMQATFRSLFLRNIFFLQLFQLYEKLKILQTLVLWDLVLSIQIGV